MSNQDYLEKSDEASFTCRQISTWMEYWAPPLSAEAWDNVGFLVGQPEERVRGILTCLDLSEKTILMADKLGLNLIITHHPLSIAPIKTITADTTAGKLAGLCWQKNIQVFCVHTNFDAAPGGLADLMAQNIGLKETKAFPGPSRSGFEGRARRGFLPYPQNGSEFVESTSRAFTAGEARLIGELPRQINCVVTQNGAYDRELLPFLKNKGNNVLVTGDVKYHDALGLAGAGIFVIDLGHHATEKVFSLAVAKRLAESFKGIIVKAADETDVYSSYSSLYHVKDIEMSGLGGRANEGRKAVSEESPGSAGHGCRVTPGEGDFKESATEINRLSQDFL